MVDISSITDSLTDFFTPRSTLTGLTLASGFLRNKSASDRGIAERSAANARAAVLRRDAENRSQVADVLRNQGRERAQQIQVETAQLIGQQRAALAANGIALNQGTAVDLVTESAGLGAVDALTAIANSEREARQLLSEAEGDRFKAGLVEQQGAERARAARSSATGALFDTGQSLARVSKLFEAEENPADASFVPKPVPKPAVPESF